MKQNKVVFLIFLALLANSSANAQGHSNEINDRADLKFIADHLISLDQETRTRLASKLYYLDPLNKKQEAQSTLLDELKKGGRVFNDKGLSPSPRTDW